MSSILDFRGLYFCAAYLPANNLSRISTIYLWGYWKGSENGQVVTIVKKNDILITCVTDFYFPIKKPVCEYRFTQVVKKVYVTITDDNVLYDCKEFLLNKFLMGCDLKREDTGF